MREATKMHMKAVCMAALMSLPATAASDTPPNIIYINTDDWGIGKVPCYKMDRASEKIIKTPNLDRLRAEGMLFTNGYAGNAVCGPARSTLITGKHPGNAPWRANQKDMDPSVWPVKSPMLGEVARQSGYKTAAFGKLTAGGRSTPEIVTSQGWDYWLGFVGHHDCRDYYSAFIYENGKKIDLPKNMGKALQGTSINKDGTTGGVVPEGTGTFIEDLYCDKAIEFMTEHKDRPFFIYYASTVPHGGPPGGMRVPDAEGYDQMDHLSLREQVYCALLTRHDRNVGRLMDTANKLGIERNTIIIWTSDNGDEANYYKTTKTFDGNGPFRSRKRSLYEGGVRVPLLAHWPGKIKPNSTCDLVTTQVDLMPTLADAGGKPITKDMDGISILPTLSGHPEDQARREYVYFEFYEAGQQQSVRMGNWKAYRNGGWEGMLELYDLSKDIGEDHDLAGAHPEIVQRMKEIMRKEHSPHPLWNLDPRKRKRK